MWPSSILPATSYMKHFHRVELLHRLQTEVSDGLTLRFTAATTPQLTTLPGLTGVVHSHTWLTSTFDQNFLSRVSQGRLSTHQQTSQSNCSFSPHLSRRIHDTNVSKHQNVTLLIHKYTTQTTNPFMKKAEVKSTFR